MARKTRSAPATAWSPGRSSSASDASDCAWRSRRQSRSAVESWGVATPSASAPSGLDALRPVAERLHRRPRWARELRDRRRRTEPACRRGAPARRGRPRPLVSAAEAATGAGSAWRGRRGREHRARTAGRLAGAGVGPLAPHRGGLGGERLGGGVASCGGSAAGARARDRDRAARTSLLIGGPEVWGGPGGPGLGAERNRALLEASIRRRQGEAARGAAAGAEGRLRRRRRSGACGGGRGRADGGALVVGDRGERVEGDGDGGRRSARRGGRSRGGSGGARRAERREARAEAQEEQVAPEESRGRLAASRAQSSSARRSAAGAAARAGAATGPQQELVDVLRSVTKTSAAARRPRPKPAPSGMGSGARGAAALDREEGSTKRGRSLSRKASTARSIPATSASAARRRAGTAFSLRGDIVAEEPRWLPPRAATAAGLAAAPARGEAAGRRRSRARVRCRCVRHGGLSGRGGAQPRGNPRGRHLRGRGSGGPGPRTRAC